LAGLWLAPGSVPDGTRRHARGPLDLHRHAVSDGAFSSVIAVAVFNTTNLQEPNYRGAVPSPRYLLDCFQRITRPPIHAALDHDFHGNRVGNSTTFDARILLPPTVCEACLGAKMNALLKLGLVGLCAVLATASQTFTVSAQERRCDRFACRALYLFKTCDKPLTGAKVLSVRVLAKTAECDNLILSVQVENSEADYLPDVVEIDLGSCIVFDGKVGDLTQIAILEPRPGARRYNLACRRY